MSAAPDTAASPAAAAMMELVDRSPRLVAAHDREGWLGLFGPRAEVADPFGTPPARRAPARRDELARFYDAFIATTDIRFEVLCDWATPRAVLRDAVLHNTLRGGARVSVATLILYEAATVGGALRLTGLTSYWDLDASSRALRGQGLAGLRSLTSTGLGLLARLGPRHLWRYFRAPAHGMGAERAARVASAVAAALSASDPGALAALGGGTLPAIEAPLGVAVADPAPLLGRRAELVSHRWGGWSLACRLARADGPLAAIVDLAPGTERAMRLRLFLPENTFSRPS